LPAKRIRVGDLPGVGIEDQDTILGRLEKPPVTELRILQSPQQSLDALRHWIHWNFLVFRRHGSSD
jgi:hypothetical protein